MNREPDDPVTELKRAFQKISSAHLNLVHAKKGLESTAKHDVGELLDEVIALKGKVWEIYERLGGQLE